MIARRAVQLDRRGRLVASIGVAALLFSLASTVAPAQPASPTKDAKAKQKDQQPTAKESTTTKPKKESKETKSTPLPSLDDLLDMPRADKDKKPQDAKSELNPDKLKLDRALDKPNVSEMFQQAVEQMADAAKLLKDAHNVGVDTQRVQEEIIKKLEKLIEEAENQQSSSSSSSSSQQQQQQQGKQPQQPQDGQNQGNKGDNKGARTPPGGQSAQLTGRIDSLGAAWGALPARLRNALLQGAGDTYSSLYESLTEAYYRRLAEQNKGSQK